MKSMITFILTILVAQITMADVLPKFLDPIPNSNGGYVTMNYQQALDYCASQGQRLPTAREFAMLTISRGGPNLVATMGQKPTDSDKVSYTFVNGVNSDGHYDMFYQVSFNSWYGFQAPTEIKEQLSFWTATRNAEHDDFIGYTYFGLTGGLTPYTLSSEHVVRCVSLK